MSVDAMTEKGASWSVRSGRMVGLRTLCLVCVLYALTALLMFAVDMVGLETLAAAIYWPPFTVLGAWLLRREPNNRDVPTRKSAEEPT